MQADPPPEVPRPTRSTSRGARSAPRDPHGSEIYQRSEIHFQSSQILPTQGNELHFRRSQIHPPRSAEQRDPFPEQPDPPPEVPRAARSTLRAAISAARGPQSNEIHFRRSQIRPRQSHTAQVPPAEIVSNHFKSFQAAPRPPTRRSAVMGRVPGAAAGKLQPVRRHALPEARQR